MAAATSELQRQVDWLLRPLDVDVQREYYKKLLPPGLEIQYNGDDGRGKRLIAAKDFEMGEVIFREPPLVAAQDAANRADALVCGQCFRFVGSIERQLHHRLLGGASGAADTAATGSAAGPFGGASCGQVSSVCADNRHGYSCEHGAHAAAPHDASSVEAETGAAAAAAAGSGSASEPADAEALAALDVSLRLVVSGGRLPRSDDFQLPGVVPCCGGCGSDVYCSAACNEAAWESHHSLLCLGACSRPAPKALTRFKQHADDTNDIFHVAARAVAGACLRAQATLGDCWADAGAQARWAALQGAWTPLGAGWKAAWWDAVALPRDVDDEAAFRAELRDLAEESLRLLARALPRQAAAFPALFSLPVYGALIGMFELNNLGVVVASPVEAFFLLLDALPKPQRTEAMAVARPLLDALGEGYAAAADGTGFYALQSCANHSCHPNAHTLKGDGDVTGDAIVTATAAILTGTEIAISYIDTELPLDERQAALADYGFTCRCGRCLQEGASAGSGSGNTPSSRKRSAAPDDAG